MNVIPYIFIPGIIGIPIFTYAFFKYPRYAIAGLIIAKPIIDLSRDYHMLLNINFLKIYAGLFVILGLIYIIYKKINVLQHPINLIWLIFLGLNFISIFIISDAFMLIDKIKYFFSILTGFVALIIFAYLFDFEKDKKFVLSIFIIAGIFPILLWLIPVLFGSPIFSNDPLRRIIGPYQGFWHFNFYATQTIICCLAYLSLKGSSFSYLLKRIASKLRLIPASRLRNFLPSKLHKSIFVLFMLFVSIVMIYKCYSKTGWITLGAIFFIWFLLRKKYIFTTLVPVIAAIIIFVNPLAKDFQKTFQNEINYFVQGTDAEEIVFRGRLQIWKTGMVSFNNLPVINKLFGAQSSIDNPVNDYLRVLWDNGILGFLSYVSLLCITGFLLISRYAATKETVFLMGILVFIMFIVNSIGSHTMMIPKFQWFMWGTVGFILSKDKVKLNTKD
jgi:O-antigen ligase